MDLSASYNTVNHRILLTILYGMTEDAEFTKLIERMMTNRRFYVELNGAIRRMVYLMVGFSHPCYSMSIQTTSLYTMRHSASSMLTACVESHNIALLSRQKPSSMKHYRIWASTMMKGISCMQILTKHKHVLSTSRNEKQVGKLNITWYNKHFKHIPNPVYLGVTLDRTLSYKEHIPYTN